MASIALSDGIIDLQLPMKAPKLLAVAIAMMVALPNLCCGQFGPPPGGVRGRGGPPSREPLALVEKFDLDGNGYLDASERKSARPEAVQARRQGPPGFRGPGRPGSMAVQPTPGPKVLPQDVVPIAGAALYDLEVVRTFFLTFDSGEWEKEMSDFRETDVDVTATLNVDGKEYPDVGVHFRGMSSYSMVQEGRKKSLNISMDLARKGQKLLGYRTLNLLNSHEDPSFLRTVLYSRIAQDYIPTPKANLVHVVINGESWGIFSNVQQFNKEFLKENFGSTAGTRWKVQGSPNGRGTLEYLGSDPQAYKQIYQIKSKDLPKAWSRLIEMIRVLNQTPIESLKAEIEPLLDVEGALRFLAIENALINNDGYWIRTSDYALFLDEEGQIHLVPHDMNEGFSRPGGPGFGGGGMRGGGRRGPPGASVDGDRGGRPDFEINAPEAGGPPRLEGRPSGTARVDGVKLDPLYAANDLKKPLINRLLGVVEYRQKYLRYVQEVADKWLDWKRLGPIAENLHKTIAPIVKADGRKLNSFEEFESSMKIEMNDGAAMSIYRFAEERRNFVLSK